MINSISSWAEQIVLAVIVSTIIEMILPNGKNKKYIKMVIGVYILFNIISPIIQNKDKFSLEKYNIEKYVTSSKYEVDQTSMDNRIEKIYLEELENTVKSKFEENGIVISKCEIDAVLDTTKKNAGIRSIIVKLKDNTHKEDILKISQELADEFEIDIEKIKIK